MAKSTKSQSGSKPAKPRPDFPLFPHATGRWAKKIRQKLHYFGKIAGDENGQAALAKWLDQKDDLLAGRTPRVKSDGLTVVDLCERFLTGKQQLRDGGELTPRTFNELYATCERLIATFGKNRLVDDLAADDFETLRASIAKVWGPVRLSNEVQRVRGVFKYGYEAGLIATPIRFGPNFKKPSRRVLRVERAKKGPRMFEATEIQTLLKAAPIQMRGMILLAANTGAGNHDVAGLPKSAVDLDRGWLAYSRNKTGIMRTCPLWPETIAALREVLAQRPEAKTEDAAELVFITKYGKRWGNNVNHNPVSQEFRKLLVKVGLHREGRGFYSLRHGFETIGGESRDQAAVDHIMGHIREDMASVYRERISDERLQAVVDHVHAWLFAKPAPAAGDDHQEAERPTLRVVG